MKWLSAKQALADTADFIRFANREYFMGDNAKWIVFGGSYSGALAAWMRAFYPELVLGAISSSGGPMETMLEFPGYTGTVSVDLKVMIDKSGFTQFTTERATKLLGHDQARIRHGRANDALA